MAHLKDSILTRFVHRYGKILVGMYKDHRDAESVVSEMMLVVEALWFRTEKQLDFLHHYWDMLSESHQRLQNRLLHNLQSKLLDFVVTFSGIVGKGGKLKKILFAVSVKDCLAHTVEELKKWQSLFDPSYFLIGLITTSASHFNQNRVAEQGDIKGASSVLQLTHTPSFAHPGSGEVEQLRQAIGTSSKDRETSVFLSDDISQTWDIAHSSARLANLREFEEMVILDTVRLRPRDETASIMRGVRELAQVLKTVDPIRFGLLSCHGVIKVEKEDTGRTVGRAGSEKRLAHFEIVFDVPQHLIKPRSLRDILLSPNPQAPLNELLAQAKSLARSVFFIHTARFVHKNIRPENILVFEDATHESGKLYLVGFEKFRADREHSMKFGDGLWECDLYRHPERQGSQPEKFYVMQHDIYSLGVVLLEIGLRISFVTPSNTGPAPHQELKVFDMHSDKDEPGHAKSFKKRFTDLATQRLPAQMGQIYTDVVLSCLKCLDSNNEVFGDQSDLEDEDGIEVGVRYIEKVWFFPSLKLLKPMVNLLDTHSTQ